MEAAQLPWCLFIYGDVLNAGCAYLFTDIFSQLLASPRVSHEDIYMPLLRITGFSITERQYRGILTDGRTPYNCGEQISVSEHITCQPLRWMSYTSIRARQVPLRSSENRNPRLHWALDEATIGKKPEWSRFGEPWCSHVFPRWDI